MVYSAPSSSTVSLEPRFLTSSYSGDCLGKNCVKKPVLERGKSKRSSFKSLRDDNDSIDSKLEQVLRQKIDDEIRRLRNECGDSHPHVEMALLSLGVACTKNGDDADAIRYFEQALQSTKMLHGDGHPKVADTLITLSTALKKEGRFRESISTLEDALSIFKDTESNVSKDDEKVFKFKRLNVFNKIGNLYFHLGMLDQAHERYKQAIDVVRKESPSTECTDSCLDLHLAGIYNNIGGVKGAQRLWDEAIDNFNKALELQTNILGEDDPAVASTLNNLGTMNFQAGKYGTALMCYKQVLRMRRDLLGKNDLSLAEVIQNIGIVYMKNKEYIRAEKAFKESLRITCEVYGGVENLNVAQILIKLGLNRKFKGDEKTATKYFEKSLEICEKSIAVETNHEAISSIQEHVAKIKKGLNS